MNEETEKLFNKEIWSPCYFYLDKLSKQLKFLNADSVGSLVGRELFSKGNLMFQVEIVNKLKLELRDEN